MRPHRSTRRSRRSRWNRRRGLTASARAAVPVRTCIGCRRVADATELVRVHRSPAGLEPGHGAGRGAWLCREHPVACLDEAVRRRALARALRITVESDEIEQLRARLDTGRCPATEAGTGKPAPKREVEEA